MWPLLAITVTKIQKLRSNHSPNPEKPNNLHRKARKLKMPIAGNYNTRRKRL